MAVSPLSTCNGHTSTNHTQLDAAQPKTDAALTKTDIKCPQISRLERGPHVRVPHVHRPDLGQRAENQSRSPRSRTPRSTTPDYTQYNTQYNILQPAYNTHYHPKTTKKITQYNAQYRDPVGAVAAREGVEVVVLRQQLPARYRLVPACRVSTGQRLVPAYPFSVPDST
eukprot:1257007-Rhodomonas_salina.2